MKINMAKSHLERQGYTDVTIPEAELYAYLHKESKMFYKVIDMGFRQAYWITKHLEIMPGDENFVPTFKRNREIAVEEALQLCREGHQDYIPVYILTDREIVKSFLEKEVDEPVKLLKAE